MEALAAIFVVETQKYEQGRRGYQDPEKALDRRVGGVRLHEG